MSSKSIPPSSILPPVFNAPPNPPNPSLAQSDNQDEQEEQFQEGIPENDSDLSSDSEDSSDESCCYDDGKDDRMGSGDPTELSAGVSDYFGKFSATTANETCLSSMAQMLEKIKETMDMEGRFLPIEGLTSAATKRQGFHAYLKSSGLLAAIGKIILGLYELDEYPTKDKLPEYITTLLDYSPKIKDDIAEASAYNRMLDIRVQRLQIENDWLYRRLDDFECSETPIEYLDPDFFDPKLNEERKLPRPLPINRREFKNIRKTDPDEFLEHKKILQTAIDEFDETEKANAVVSQKVSKILGKESVNEGRPKEK
jgi:hypothetical protein